MQKFKLEMKKNALFSSKFEEAGHPTEEYHSPIQTTFNLRDLCYTTKKKVRFNQEKYEVLNYKNENSQNLWQKYHKSKAKKFVSLSSPNLSIY